MEGAWRARGGRVEGAWRCLVMKGYSYNWGKGEGKLNEGCRRCLRCHA